MHAAIERYIDDNLLAGAAAVVLENNRIVDHHLWGYADIESGRPIETDTIFRIYSNTKIVTSVAAMCLFEDGRFSLDDPIDEYLPELSELTVLKPDARDIGDTEPLASRPTVRQVMCHNAGFSYGVLSEAPILDAAYMERGINAPDSTLADMVTRLSGLPLANQPGTRWRYSVSTDILARLIEVWSNRSFPDFLAERLFGPLKMVDTGFHAPASKHDRLATNYRPVDPTDPMKPGLQAVPEALDAPWRSPQPFTSGGAGLVSTLGDYTNFISMLIGNGQWQNQQILTPETVSMMHTNQLPAGVDVHLPRWVMPDTVFGLGLAIKTAPREGEPKTAVGEYHWGGMAGTHSWVSPAAGLAAIIFTQRLPGFWHPFSHEFKRLVYQAV